MIEAEEEAEIRKAEIEFKQAVRLSALNLIMPDVYERLFDPQYIPPSEEGEGTEGVFFPVTDEDFKFMMEEIEREELERELSGVFNTEA